MTTTTTTTLRRLLRIAILAAIALRPCLGQMRQHGYSERPRSRAYLCRLRLNKNCGSVVWEPQSLEAQKGFPRRGPRDGRIASADGRFPELDEYGRDRWYRETLDLKRLNETHSELDVSWIYTAEHATSKYELWVSQEADQPLTRSNLHHLATVHHLHRRPRKTVRFVVPNRIMLRERLGTLLCVWEIADTEMAFYQTIDYKLPTTNSNGGRDTRVKRPRRKQSLPFRVGRILFRYINDQ